MSNASSASTGGTGGPSSSSSSSAGHRIFHLRTDDRDKNIPSQDRAIVTAKFDWILNLGNPLLQRRDLSCHSKWLTRLLEELGKVDLQKCTAKPIKVIRKISKLQVSTGPDTKEHCLPSKDPWHTYEVTITYETFEDSGKQAKDRGRRMNARSPAEDDADQELGAHTTWEADLRLWPHDSHTIMTADEKWFLFAATKQKKQDAKRVPGSSRILYETGFNLDTFHKEIKEKNLFTELVLVTREARTLFLLLRQLDSLEIEPSVLNKLKCVRAGEPTGLKRRLAEIANAEVPLPAEVREKAEDILRKWEQRESEMTADDRERQPKLAVLSPDRPGKRLEEAVHEHIGVNKTRRYVEYWRLADRIYRQLEIQEAFRQRIVTSTPKQHLHDEVDSIAAKMLKIDIPKLTKYNFRLSRMQKETFYDDEESDSEIDVHKGLSLRGHQKMHSPFSSDEDEDGEPPPRRAKTVSESKGNAFNTSTTGGRTGGGPPEKGSNHNNVRREGARQSLVLADCSRIEPAPSHKNPLDGGAAASARTGEQAASAEPAKQTGSPKITVDRSSSWEALPSPIRDAGCDVVPSCGARSRTASSTLSTQNGGASASSSSSSVCKPQLLCPNGEGGDITVRLTTVHDGGQGQRVPENAGFADVSRSGKRPAVRVDPLGSGLASAKDRPPAAAPRSVTEAKRAETAEVGTPATGNASSLPRTRHQLHGETQEKAQLSEELAVLDKLVNEKLSGEDERLKPSPVVDKVTATEIDKESKNDTNGGASSARQKKEAEQNPHASHQQHPAKKRKIASNPKGPSASTRAKLDLLDHSTELTRLKRVREDEGKETCQNRRQETTARPATPAETQLQRQEADDVPAEQKDRRTMAGEDIKNSKAAAKCDSTKAKSTKLKACSTSSSSRSATTPSPRSATAVGRSSTRKGAKKVDHAGTTLSPEIADSDKKRARQRRLVSGSSAARNEQKPGSRSSKTSQDHVENNTSGTNSPAVVAHAGKAGSASVPPVVSPKPSSHSAGCHPAAVNKAAKNDISDSRATSTKSRAKTLRENKTTKSPREKQADARDRSATTKKVPSRKKRE
ncbi:unnamed protein product [Amoebophrya sp. A120]|nr:unnamed protein product [Amoebophrya sp. A120]|eukprot:GSA120T00002517001.1